MNCAQVEQRRVIAPAVKVGQAEKYGPCNVLSAAWVLYMKRGDGLKRDTPDARKKRKKPMTRSQLRRKANRFLTMKRKALRKKGLRYTEHRKECFGDKAEWVRTLPCLICENTPSDPHHEPTVARGGKAKDLTPLCRFHHGQRHSLGSAKRFKIVHDIDLLVETERIEFEWQAMR